MAKKLSKTIQERRRKRLNAVPLVTRNRFEVHLNRSKYNILGKKEKHDRGQPGISRSKGNEKRRKTLLVKYKQRNKSNVMIDKRFGEFDETLSVEEKMLKRFTLEKQSHHVKAGHYNIEDDEELTHYGQNLADIENFDELEFELSDEENGDADLYGGFLTKKQNISKTTHQEGESGDRKLTQKERLQEMIIDSKRDKNERRKTKELSFELTQRLDKEWKDIQSMLTKRSDNNSTEVKKDKKDDYDKIVRELAFEAKGKPSERLKSAEEIAKVEKRRLEEMEKKQLQRMELVDDEDDLIHQSADALIKKLPKKVDDRYMLQYKDGQMVMPDDGIPPSNDLVQNECLGDDGHDGDVNSDCNDNSMEELIGVTDVKVEVNKKDGIDDDGNDGDDDEEEEEEEEEGDEDEDEDEDEDADDGDDVSSEADTDNEDVFSDEEAIGDDHPVDSKEKEVEMVGDINEVKTGMVLEGMKIKKKDKKVSTLLDNVRSSKVKIKEATGDKCSTNYNVPENLETLLKTIQSSKSDISSLLSKMRRLNIGNKKYLERLLDILFEYIDHICDQPEPAIHNINILGGLIQELAKDIPLYITRAIQSKLKVMLKRITACISCKTYSEICPSLRELMLLKVIELVFPTSDLSHEITTPTLLMISLIFVKARLADMKSLLRGVFLLDIVYNYVKLSKRYLPELILFISRILYEAVPVNVKLNKITSSVLNTHRYKSGILYICEDDKSELCRVNISMMSPSTPLASLENVAIKLSCIKNILLLTEKFCVLYKEMETFKELFEPVSTLIRLLPVENYPTSLKTIHSKFVEQIESKSTEKVPLKLQTRKPIPLTLLEPQFEEVNDKLLKRHSGDKAKNEYDKLKYKVKRELKGAVKEIRKDSHYLAKQQLGEQMEKDATRKRKVKELKSALENEGREIREMEKRGKKK